MSLDGLDAVVVVGESDSYIRDPLKVAQLTRVQREFFRWINDPSDPEVYWRSGNSGAKTRGGAIGAFILARGDKDICDVFGLPYIPAPNVGWVLTQSYKQQVDASQKALLEVVGGWPHYLTFVTGKGKGYGENLYIATNACKHDTGTHCPTCSKITFHCEESESALGGRIDWAWADEPPDEDAWREIRGRRTANRNFPRFITATPLQWARWWWLKEDFDRRLVFATKAAIQADEDFHGEANGRRVEIRSTIYDNEFLSNEHINKQIEDWEGDNLIDARIRGDYVDAAGESPFNWAALDRWEARCTKGTPVLIDSVRTQVDRHEGRVIVPMTFEIEVWWEAEEGEKYFLVADLSSGIKKRGRDPSSIIVVARRRPRVVARYGWVEGHRDPWQGYIAPYGAGSLSAILARRYNNALVAPEMNGGWGDPFLSALNAAHYTHIYREIDPDKPGYINTRLGYRNTVSNRGSLVGAIQPALDEDSIVVKSIDMVHSLKNVILVRNDKGFERHEASKGKRDDDFITLGQALTMLAAMPLKPIVTGLRESSRKRRLAHQHRTPTLRWK